ncbi:MAG: TonB-dependent receptor, partial [Pseudomonadota bacterium]
MTINKLRRSTALAAIVAFALPSDGLAEETSSLDIPSQDMVTAIAALGAETGLQILGADELLTDRKSASVKGSMTPRQALVTMLNDNTLSVTELSSGTLVIGKAEHYGEVSQNLTDEPFDLGEIIFRSSRGRVPINEVPRNVAVIEEEQLRQLNEQSGNLAETLPKVIPSFGPPQFRNSTRGVTLRGRAPLYLLDGIPISTQTIQTLGFIDQSAVDSVEVLYGPTALYGNGASGGVIQFFTVEPS